MAVVSLAMSTKLWDSTGREYGFIFLYLHLFSYGKRSSPEHKIHIKFTRMSQSECLPRLFRCWFDFILFDIDSGYEGHSGELHISLNF